jgi:hypothetical protein
VSVLDGTQGQRYFACVPGASGKLFSTAPEVSASGADFFSLLHSTEGVKPAFYVFVRLMHQRWNVPASNGFQSLNVGAPELRSSSTVSLAAAQTGPAKDLMLSR